MMVKQTLRVMFATLFFVTTTAAAGDDKFWTSSYCVPVAKIQLNPMHEINDGKEMAYAILLRSYISTDKNEQGILEKYEFSPDGKSFTALVTKDLKWNDGTPVTSLEAGLGIVKSLPYRVLGKRLHVIHAQNETSGVDVINNRTFRITFETSIDNPTGVIREALSTNSRENRMWPFKRLKDQSQPLVLTKYPFIMKGKEFGFQVNDQKIQMTDNSSCHDPDFSMFPEALKKDIREYKYARSTFPASISVETNTTRLPIEERRALIVWIRNSFEKYGSVLGIVPVTTFFMQGEPGFRPSSSWPTKANDDLLKKKKIIKIAYEMPFFRTILEEANKVSQLHIEFVKFPFEENDVDAEVIASTIQEGRHLCLQDLEWPHTSEFLGAAPKTLKQLKIIAEKSASTIPADNETLQKFEISAISEESWAPVARKFPTAYSKSTAPICLKWTTRGELSFGPPADCTLLGNHK